MNYHKTPAGKESLNECGKRYRKSEVGREKIRSVVLRYYYRNQEAMQERARQYYYTHRNVKRPRIAA